jgi:predicted nucleotidyltransferase
MITKNRIEQVLKEQRSLLNRKFKVKRIGIFGSYTLDRATEESDVDLLVEFSEPVGWEFIDLHDYLEEILGRKVDLATVGALKPQLKDSILNEVVYIWLREARRFFWKTLFIPQIRSDVRFRYPHVPWKRMVGLRNIVIHAYFNVDPNIIWQIVTSNLREIGDDIKSILDNL